MTVSQLVNLLGCEWGRAVMLPDDRERCHEQAVQRVMINGGTMQLLIQLCAVHRDLVFAHTDRMPNAACESWEEK